MAFSTFATPITGPDNDPLADGPPRPSLPDASKPKRKRADGGPDTSTLSSVLASGPTQTVMRNMMMIEKLIKECLPYAPELGPIFAPAIDQARSVAAASLGNIAQGGNGSLPENAGAPAPASAAMGPGGAGAGVPPMPMPPM